MPPSSRPVPGPPICVWCGRTFPTYAELRTHEQQEREALEQEEAEVRELLGDRPMQLLLNDRAELLALQLEAERRPD